MYVILSRVVEIGQMGTFELHICSVSVPTKEKITQLTFENEASASS